MTIYDFIYLLAFLGILAMLLAKLWNTMNLGKIYDIKVGILLFVGITFAYGLQFITFMLLPERMIFMMLFNVSTALFGFNILFLFIELFFYIQSSSQTVQAYYSNRR